MAEPTLHVERRGSLVRNRTAAPLNRGIPRRRLLQGALLGGTGVAALLRQRSLDAAPRRQDAAQTFTLVTPRTPSDLDPHSAYDAGSGVVLQGAFEGLIRLKPGTADTYVPVLAESWTANDDRSVWTFRLREGVTFHDGTPLSAESARASFQRLLTLRLAPAAVLGRFIDDPAMIEARDAQTLVFDLGRPQPLFEAAIASAYGTAIVNVVALQAHEVDGDQGHAWAQARSDGIGTGPYRIVDFDGEAGVVLERNDRYWREWAEDQFERIVIRVVVEPETRRELIERGDADLVTTLPLATMSALQRHPDLVVNHQFNLNVRYLAMTVAGPLQPPEARQALCWAFPYSDVVHGVYEGYAKQAIGPVAELCRGFDANTFVYRTDLDRARALLQRAGVAEGTTLTMLLPPGNLETASTAELLRENLGAIGLNLEIEPVDFATYVGIFTGDLPAEERPNLFPSFWQPDYNDAWNHLWPQVSCAAWRSGNVGHYCNDRVETLLELARTTGDSGTYQSALSEIQQIVTRDDPAAIYYVQPELLTVRRRSVSGFAPDLVLGEFFDYYALHRT